MGGVCWFSTPRILQKILVRDLQYFPLTMDDVKQKKQKSQENIKQQPNPSTSQWNKEKISQVLTPR